VRVVGARTHKVPTGPYRGAGRPEAALVIERLVDVAAQQLEIDRIELRRRNLVRSFPHRTPTGLTYDSGDYERCLDRALEVVGPVEDGEGLGVALYVERVGPGWEYASVTVEEGGRVVCRVGSTPHGQGHETTFAQIAAQELGVPLEQVEIRWGDSAEIRHGIGTFASRSVTVGGSALLLACREVKGKEPPAFAETRFELPGPAFSSGCYAAVVSVDRETGEPHVHRIAAVDDAGVIVNPLLAEGQVVGAVAQAIGECFYEHLDVDEDGQPRVVNFYEYHLPTAQNVVPVETELVETPSPLNPLGAKGIGEAGSIGTTAAVANAIADALGVRHVDLPFTPSRLYDVIRQTSE
jgi:carbon-monoxide dehydrogenase large subunit